MKKAHGWKTSELSSLSLFARLDELHVCTTALQFALEWGCEIAMEFVCGFLPERRRKKGFGVNQTCKLARPMGLK